MRCYMMICPASNSSLDSERQLTLKSSSLTKYKSVQFNHDNAILTIDLHDAIRITRSVRTMQLKPNETFHLMKFRRRYPVDAIQSMQSSRCNPVDAIQSMQSSRCNSAYEFESMQSSYKIQLMRPSG